MLKAGDLLPHLIIFSRKKSRVLMYTSMTLVRLRIFSDQITSSDLRLVTDGRSYVRPEFRVWTNNITCIPVLCREAVSDEGSQDIFTYLGSASDYSDEPCWKSSIICSWIWVGYSRRSLVNVLRKSLYSCFLLLWKHPVITGDYEERRNKCECLNPHFILQSCF